MTKYVKNEPGYEDANAIKEAYAKKKKAKKNPTSINLPDSGRLMLVGFFFAFFFTIRDL